MSVSGSVSAHAGVGGVVGRMTLSGTISDCANSAAVTAMTGVGNVGGIVGAAYYTTDTGEMVIEGCTNTGTVKGTQAAGGIAGLCSAFVSECGNNGAVEAEHYSVGGVVGEQKNYGGIHHCTNSAKMQVATAAAALRAGCATTARRRPTPPRAPCPSPTTRTAARFTAATMPAASWAASTTRAR